MTVPIEERVPINDDSDVVEARQRGRRLATELGFSSTDLTLIATAISEVARNITNYAGRGEILLSLLHENGRDGIVVVAHDDGPGIEDVDQAMRDGFTSGTGMGLGLPGARRLMDAFDIDSDPSRGTTVTMKKWAQRRA